MSLEKSDKWLIIKWIDMKFATSPLFPEKHVEFDAEAGEQITPAHLEAWREWRELSTRWSEIKPWAKKNLSEDERVALEKHLKKIHKNREE